MPSFNYNKLLSSKDIQDIGQQTLGIWINVYSRDEMPTVIEPGFYVINLDSQDGPGTHWVSFIKINDDDVLYFDSFGFPPPQEQIDAFLRNHDKVFHNKRQIQDIKSILCGYYCIGFFKFFLEHGVGNRKKPTEPLQKYAELFDTNTKKNNELLKKYLQNI